MKTAIKIALILGVIAAFMVASVRTYAADEGEYIVSMSGDEYTLSYRMGTSPSPILRSSDITELCNYINERSAEGCVIIIFAGIECAQDIVFSGGEFLISGTISLVGDADFVIEKGSVILNSFNMNINGGSMRIKDGTVSFKESELICEKESAVVMDYASGARFDIISGAITSDSESAAISLLRGTVSISGGKVESVLGYAVDNAATLKLSGTPIIKGAEHDIITGTPVYLSAEKEFSGSLRVKYSHSFQEGEIYPTFYSASAVAIENIRLFDKYNTEYELSFFAEHHAIDDKKFAGVYLPHIVDFYSDGILIAKKEVLTGETATPEQMAAKIGYSFYGWTTEDGETYIDFAQGVEKSLNAHAKYKLNPPTFSLSSLSFIYDKNEHGLSLNDVDHPLLEYGQINCIWYRNGVELTGSGQEIKLKNVNESGNYKCKLYFTHNGEIATAETPEVEVKISKAQVKIPQAEPKYYTGMPESPDLFSTAIYNVELPSGIKVGVYPVKLSLADPDNYIFENGSYITETDFEILKADNSFTSPVTVENVYEGFLPSPLSATRFGKVTYIYSDSYDGVYTDKIPDSIGSYYCIAFVEGTENYNALTSLPCPFSVLEEKITGISISRMPDKTSYTAFDKFDTTGLFISVFYNSSKTEEIGEDKYAVSYISGSTLKFNDNYVTASYGGFSVAVPVNVTKAEYDISGISFSDKSVIYDATHQSISFEGALPLGLDGFELSANVNGGGTDAGVYVLYLSFKSDSPNYKLPDKMAAILTVLPRECEAVFENTEFVYDGALKCPTAYYRDIDGRKCALMVTGERSLAGEYTASAICYDSNYKLLNPDFVYSIAKANYDLSDVMWCGGEYVYDGYERSVSLCGLPAGITVVGYSDNKAINAGIYTAVAVLLYDENNYNPPPKLSYTWEIKKADYNLGGFEFISSYPMYNGAVQYPTLVGSMPMGIDGKVLEYRFSGGALNVNDGSVNVEIIFSSKSENYNAPPSQFATVQVMPMELLITWSGLEFVYDMEPHTPTAGVDVGDILVLGGMVNAGSHTAFAISLDPNYSIKNPSVEFVIKKAENAWISPLQIENIYEDEMPDPKAHCIAGEVNYYYTDLYGERLDGAPELPGIYYAIAFSSGNENYKPITSVGVRFEVFKIVPIGISVVLNKTDYFAFEKVSDGDITAMLINNNGSLTPLYYEDITLKYQSGRELRYSDTCFTVSYGTFTETIGVNVSKASYDLGSVYWSQAEFVYDGTEKRMELIGLPAGIKIMSYIGGIGTDAGEYPVSVSIDYDSHNYNFPNIGGSTLKIRKQTVILPVFPEIYYNGGEQTLHLPENGIYEIKADVGINAGLYAVDFYLKDTDNYEFEGGASKVGAYYEIKPISIEILIKDLDKYLFSKLETPEYEIITGALAEGDELELSFNVAGDRVTCRSENPNYSVTFDGGMIKKHNKLSNDGIFYLFLFILILLTVALLVLILIRRRYEIGDYLAKLKCRQNTALYLPSNSQGNALSDVSIKKTDEENSVYEEKIEIDISVDAERADTLITDDLAKDLVRREGIKIYTSGRKKGIINVDTLSENFISGDIVDVNKLKDMSLIPYDTAYIKVLARGMIDKPLRVYANDFSLSAVKMLALTGGEAVRVVTVKIKGKKDIGESEKNSEMS